MSPFSPLTTIGIGGEARFFARTADHAALDEALSWAADSSLPVFVLGGGSNILFPDAGFPGLVIQPTFMGMETHDSADSVTVKVSAGETWDSFVAHAVESSWHGIECLSGIPGLVGASPIQNIGAYGQEVCETITEVEAWDRHAHKLRAFSNADCEFGYRASRFKGRDKDQFVITAVTFQLSRTAHPAVRYAELSRYFADKNIPNPALADVRHAVLEIRGRKAMVIDPAEPNSRSCGSFFTNPIITRERFEELLTAARLSSLLKDGESMPSFDAGPGQVKLSAAWLIEHAGLRRGYKHGNVGLSEKHVLAIINRGGGTASEVMELVREVQTCVAGTFGIRLEAEPELF